MELHYLYGKPEAAADFKRQPEDFIVDEILDIELTGEGEHVCLHIIKKQINTSDVAKKIAKQAGTHVKNVSYAGLKDRHGVCSQWFSVPVPIKKGVDFTELNDDFIFVAKQKRHNRKLRTGCHSGNRFTITLRNIDKPLDILSRINAVRQGVPNYFGEQRFGHDGHNLTMAERMFSGEHIRDRKLRSIVISAARSHIFNQLVSMRVEEHGLAKTWHREIFMLEGSNAFFEDDISDENIARLTSGDICLSAPLVGKGEKGLIAQEKQFLEAFSAWHHGLAELGLKNERRALRLIPIDLEVKTLSSDSIELRFALPKGTFATAVLRELVNYVDVNKNAFANKEER